MHFLRGGASRHGDWLAQLLAHADRILAGQYATWRPRERPGEELFVGVAPRRRQAGDRDAVTGTRWLWIDVDRPDRLDALWSFVAERPCHLLIASGGSGGVHAYWQLDQELPASWTRADGTISEPIERANGRIIRALGVDRAGRPDVADPQCAGRARVMRLAGTINHKSGAWSRILEADLALAPYPVHELVGDLPDPPGEARRAARRGDGTSSDPYKQIAPAEYFLRLAGVRVPRNGLVSCPAPWHHDTHPSCSVGRRAEQGWCCHSASCGARGAIYDLASVLSGGPWGPQLRGEAFARARAHVVRVFGRMS